MRKGLFAALAIAMLAITVPASAGDYHRRGGHHHHGNGAAVVLGVMGAFTLGAILAQPRPTYGAPVIVYQQTPPCREGLRQIGWYMNGDPAYERVFVCN